MSALGSQSDLLLCSPGPPEVDDQRHLPAVARIWALPEMSGRTSGRPEGIQTFRLSHPQTPTLSDISYPTIPAIVGR